METCLALLMRMCREALKVKTEGSDPLWSSMQVRCFVATLPLLQGDGGSVAEQVWEGREEGDCPVLLSFGKLVPPQTRRKTN